MASKRDMNEENIVNGVLLDLNRWHIEHRIRPAPEPEAGDDLSGDEADPWDRPSWADFL